MRAFSIARFDTLSALLTYFPRAFTHILTHINTPLYPPRHSHDILTNLSSRPFPNQTLAIQYADGQARRKKAVEDKLLDLEEDRLLHGLEGDVGSRFLKVCRETISKYEAEGKPTYPLHVALAYKEPVCMHLFSLLHLLPVLHYIYFVMCLSSNLFITHNYYIN